MVKQQLDRSSFGHRQFFRLTVNVHEEEKTKCGMPYLFMASSRLIKDKMLFL